MSASQMSSSITQHDHLVEDENQIRILVIEDEIDLCIDIVEMLSLESYMVDSANDGATGITKAIKNPPDIILCDIMMPQVDGYQVLQTLRAYPTTRLIPFVFMTARASRRDVRVGMELGADDYLTKPFSYDELLQAIDTQLAKAQAIAAAQSDRIDQLRSLIARSLPHEFRTPLTTILGFADLMVMDAKDNDDQETLLRATEVYNAGKRLHRLVENYLLYTELSTLPVGDKGIPFQLNLRAYETPDSLYLEAMSVATSFDRQNDLACYLNESALPLDTALTVKVVHELLRNAFANSEAGCTVALITRWEDDAFILEIRDEGRGMSQDEIKQIGAYMQFNRHLYEQQGVGLGLAIVRQLVRLSNGQMHIQSQKSIGTTVTITYPKLD